MMMYRLKVLAVLAVVFAGFSPAVQAQEPTPSQLALAKEFVAASGAAASFEGVIPAYIEQAKAYFLQTNPDLARQLNESGEAARASFMPRLDELITEVAKAYARRFTEGELKELVAFYKSDLGRKLVNENPLVLQESFSRAQEWANRISEEIMQKVREEMKKKGFDL